MQVLKFGGSCLDSPQDHLRAVKIVKDHLPGPDMVIVVSAARYTTDTILNFLDGGVETAGEDAIRELLEGIRSRHRELIEATLHDRNMEVMAGADRFLMGLERLLHGISLTGELTPRTRDMALSYGERLSAAFTAACLSEGGIPAEAVEADRAGLLSDGEFGNASVEPDADQTGFRETLKGLLKRGTIPVVTGFFGADASGRVTIFGRGGSDYSAAVIASVMDADVLEIWKDVDGFMSADPKMIGSARLLARLSYREAAELAYFGAKVIHPRTVEPLRKRGIPVVIRNTLAPSGPGSVIVKHKTLSPGEVRSVAYSRDVAVLKVHGVGVGLKRGVLNQLTGALSDSGINIRSVITSQTCISFLLQGGDLEEARTLLGTIDSPVVERLEAVDDIALIGIVGEGIVSSRGLAARAFGAVADHGVNVTMISAGASEVAYYFVVEEKELERAINAVHDEFFPRETLSG